ncbi:MAG: hypothetical protein KKE96_04170 [Candidatus Altiarchaeota archaeon]|nr:hypothetical protein [Candidatus Altiarchaeota archaeon]
MMVSDKKLELWIIKKLVRHKYWGKGHISSDNLVKGQDRKYKERLLEIADRLVKEGLLIKFPHGKERHYHLNKEYRREIHRIIESSV